MRNPFAAVELIEALLNGGKKIHTFRDVDERGVIGQFIDGIERNLLLRHGGKYEADGDRKQDHFKSRWRKMAEPRMRQVMSRPTR